MESRPRYLTNTGLPARILLAEDDEEFRSLVAATLRRDGHSVIEAVDGTEFVDLLAESLVAGRIDRVFDLIITDIRMPGYSGLDVLHAAQSTGTSPPVLVITAFGDQRLHERARRLGSVGTLDKPFDMGVLRRLVLDTLRESVSLGQRTESS